MRLAVLVICEHESGCGEMAPGEVTGISMPSWSEPDNSMSSDEEPKLEVDLPKGWAEVHDHAIWGTTRVICPKHLET